MSQKYIRERYGYCQRSGKRVPRRLMVEDGDIPGMMVAPDWYEPEHPQKKLDPLPPENLRPELTEPPLSEEQVRIKLPDADFTGAQATYYRFGTPSSVQAALAGDTALFGALLVSGAQFSTMSAYTGAGEVSGPGYESGGYELAYQIRNYPGATVVWVGDLLTTDKVTLGDVGGMVLYAANGANPALATIQFRESRPVPGMRVMVSFPTATPDIGVAVYRS